MVKKKTIKKILKPLKQIKEVAKYIGNKEIYIPNFKKIVKSGDLIPEMSIKEARARRDFTTIKKEN